MVFFSHVDMLNFNNIHFYINDIKIGDQQLPYRYELKYSFFYHNRDLVATKNEYYKTLNNKKV